MSEMKGEESSVRITTPPQPLDESSPVCPLSSASNSETVKEVETTKTAPRWIQFEVVNIVDLLIVVFCGIALLTATIDHSSDVIYTITGGFMGYLGGTGRSLIARQMLQQNTTTKTTTMETGTEDGKSKG